MPKSRYPSAIDNDSTLPQTMDGASQFRADIPNSLKSAILAVEKTLGVNPQGTQPTLVDRLNASTNPDGSIKSSAIATTATADRNMLVTDGGTVTWDFNNFAVTWDEDIKLRFPGSGGTATIVPATTVFLISTGDIIYVEPSRTGSAPTRNALVANLSDNNLVLLDLLVLAVRDESGFIHWRNGTVMSPNSSMGFGGTIAENVFYDNTLSNLDAETVQDAITTLDSYTQYIDRDRNLGLKGDASSIDFDAGTGELSWTGDFIIDTPTDAYNAIIRDSNESPITIPIDGYLAIVELDETQTTDYFPSVSIVPVGGVPFDGHSTVLARRDGDNVHLLNGQTIFNPTQPVDLGEMSANHIVFDDSGLTFTAADSQEALVALDGIADALDTRVTDTESDISALTASTSKVSEQDRNTFMVGGGDFTWDNGTSQFTFTSTIRVYSPNLAGDALVTATSWAFDADRKAAYISLNRSATIDYTVAATIVSEDLVPSGDNIVVLATRADATKIVLKSGQVVFTADDAIELGEIAGNRVTFDPSGTALTETNLQDAVIELDAIVTGLGGGSGLDSGTLIMFNGASCPAGTTQVAAGLNGAYPRLANAASLSAAGSSTHDHGTHVHSGSAAAAGNHSHSMPNHSLFNLNLGGFGVFFDAFFASINNLSNTGSTGSGGNHSHSLSINSASVPSASHEPVHFDVLLCEVN